MIKAKERLSAKDLCWCVVTIALLLALTVPPLVGAWRSLS